MSKQVTKHKISTRRLENAKTIVCYWTVKNVPNSWQLVMEQTCFVAPFMSQHCMYCRNGVIPTQCMVLNKCVASQCFVATLYVLSERSYSHPGHVIE